jgi:hypothetical protein
VSFRDDVGEAEAVLNPNDQLLGWRPEDVAIDEPTRNSRLRWVIVVDAALPPGAAVNAVACVAAHVGRVVGGLLGPDGTDASGGGHPGLPWAGCTVLAASADMLTEIRRKAVTADGVDVCDTPASAQTNRVYAEYLAELSRTQDHALQLRALSLFGPRNRISKLTGKLELLQ